jgi:L-ascorbate metabolism protein UlaG (beta-lactamase superfamily)
MSTMSLTHIGGPTVLIEVDGWRILTDPTFDPPGRTYRFGWGTSSRKTTGPAVAPDAVGPIDAVLLTHDHHADNLDDAGRGLLHRAGAVLTTASGAGRLGGSACGLRAWDTFRLDRPGSPTLTVAATPCRHGPVGSRPITWQGQRNGALWITGDSVLYAGLREVRERLDVGTVILHLGRVRFGLTGRVRYTMDVDDAIELCRDLSPRTVIPVHYEGWSHFTQGSDEVTARLAGASDVEKTVVWARPGEPVSLEI